MKDSSTTLLLLCILVISPGIWAYSGNSYSGNSYSGNSYSAIRQAVFSQAYDHLPQYEVAREHFDTQGENQLLKAARRTLSNREDMLDFPGGQKLLQANGICFAGYWIIDRPSPYSGLFRTATRLPVIARASVALSGTRQNDKRAFGLALKLFPTGDPDLIVPTRNAFVMHSMGGTRSRYVLDLVLDNEPPLGSLPPLGQLRTAYRMLSDLKTADQAISGGKADVGFRPVDHLAADETGEVVSAPKWLRLTAASEQPRIDRADFRDELRVQHYPGQRLQWLLAVAPDNEKGKSAASWQTIGRLVFSESITSPACDKRLHFHHPPLVTQ